MEKTKLHVSTSLLAALLCLIAYYWGNYVVIIAAVAYVLLREDSVWLKRFSVKVLVLMLGFSILNTIINLLPNLIDLLFSFLRIFDVHNRPEFFNFIDNVFSFLGDVATLIRKLVFLLVGAAALIGKDVKIPVLDAFVEKRVG